MLCRIVSKEGSNASDQNIGVPRPNLQIIPCHKHIMKRKQHGEPKLLLLRLLRQLLGRRLHLPSLALTIPGPNAERTFGRLQHLGHRGLEHLDRLQGLALELLVLGELGQADDEISEGALRDDDAEIVIVDLGHVIVGEVDDALYFPISLDHVAVWTGLMSIP